MEALKGLYSAMDYSPGALGPPCHSTVAPRGHERDLIWPERPRDARASAGFSPDGMPSLEDIEAHWRWGGVSGAGGGRGDYIAFNVFVSWRERSRKEAVVFCLFHEFFHGEKKVLIFFLF